jgi:hypothetical protein
MDYAMHASGNLWDLDFGQRRDGCVKSLLWCSKEERFVEQTLAASLNFESTLF